MLRAGQAYERATQWHVDMTDLHLPALRMARPARGRTLYYDVTQADPSLLDSYDAAFVFDVIEHLESPGPIGVATQVPAQLKLTELVRDARE